MINKLLRMRKETGVNTLNINANGGEFPLSFVTDEALLRKAMTAYIDSQPVEDIEATFSAFFTELLTQCESLRKDLYQINEAIGPDISALQATKNYLNQAVQPQGKMKDDHPTKQTKKGKPEEGSKEAGKESG